MKQIKGNGRPNYTYPKRNGESPSFQFADNRSETVFQRKLKEMANSRKSFFTVSQVFSNISTPIQKIDISKEKTLQGKLKATQKQGSEEVEMVKDKFEPIQKKENNTGLPDNLKSGIENLSGLGMDDVKVHYNSDKPRDLQAHAFAQGTDIHVAPGQERHLPHEAWHVVQQKQGRVKPTMQMKGNVNVNDDKGLEKEADMMGTNATMAGIKKLSEIQSDINPDNYQQNTNNKKNKNYNGKVVQKLPTEASIKGKLGEPKKSIRPGHGSKKYKAILDAVTEYHNYISTTKFIKSSYAGQFGSANLILEKIKNSARVYSQNKDKAKPKYMYETLIPEIDKEKAIIAEAVLMVHSGKIKNYSVMVPPTLSTLLFDAMSGNRDVSLSEKDADISERGGSSEVTRFNLPGNKQGYFKENKETLTHFKNEDDEQSIMADLNSRLKPDEAALEFNALQNESNLGVGVLKINPKDAHMAKRDVAMHRLDRLLGANVIAKATIATRNLSGNKIVKGSLMDKAEGDQAASLMKKKLMAKDSNEKSTMHAKAINQQDPTLMMLLSKLQLLDLIAHQIDRNPKNFYIQSNTVGKVTGLTGIDNDLAFGTETDNEKPVQELPGMSRYVDKSLAIAIMQLDTSLIPLVFGDLLSTEEISALTTRLKNVQKHLAGVGINNFLDPNQWTALVSQGLIAENKSYFADLEMNKRKYGK